MATFELQGPDGGTYQVDAPDPQTAFAALHGGTSAPDANPFNRQMGSDVSYGAPLQSPIPTPDLDRAGELRAMMGGPITDRGAALMQSHLPPALGGTGQDYSANLATNRADTALAQAAHPAAGMAGDVAGAIPYAALAPEGILGAAGAGAVANAASSPDWSNLPQTGLSALEGAGIGGGIGVAGRAIGRAITPFEPDANRLALVDALQGAGVPVTAGQMVGSPVLQSLEREGIGAKSFASDQNKAFTGALMDQGGIPASTATQPSIAAAKTAIGNQFDALGSRNSVTVDDGLRDDVLDAVADYKRLGGNSPGVETAANDLLYRNEPSIDGDVYNSVQSGLGKDAQTLRKSDPAQAQAYRDIQGALDDAMERSIAKNNPDDLGAFREVRRQYGNFQDISKAASKITGENAVQGLIPPNRMQTVLSSGNKAPGYAAGQGDLAELTRAGAGILQPPPAYRNPLTYALMNHAIGAGLGGVAGYHEGGLGGAATGLAAGALAPKVAGTLLRAPMVQSYLKNQVAPGIGRSPQASSLAAALAAYSSAGR